jgi:hypothetical protein
MGPEVIGVFIPIILGLGLFAMVFGLRYLRNRENMAMIEKGMDPKLNASRPAPYRSLKVGLLFVGAGMGLILAYFLDNYAFRQGDNNEAIYFALIAIGGGLGLIASYRVEKKELLDKPNDNIS